MHTGYWHVVANCLTVRRGDKFVNLYSSVKVVDHFNRNVDQVLLGSYKSKAEAEARKSEIEVN